MAGLGGLFGGGLFGGGGGRVGGARQQSLSGAMGTPMNADPGGTVVPGMPFGPIGGDLPGGGTVVPGLPFGGIEGAIAPAPTMVGGGGGSSGGYQTRHMREGAARHRGGDGTQDYYFHRGGGTGRGGKGGDAGQPGEIFYSGPNSADPAFPRPSPGGIPFVYPGSPAAIAAADQQKQRTQQTAPQRPVNVRRG